MIPTSIDGTDITGATIDGTDVQEITVDGDTVFSAAPSNLPVAYSNLIAWYPFDSATYGGSNADDVTAILGGSGDDTAYNGTVDGANYQVTGGVTDINAGANSGAFEFDGSNDRIEVTHDPGLDQNVFTWMAWTNPDSVFSDFLWNKSDGTHFTWFGHFNRFGRAYDFRVRDSNGNRDEIFTSGPTSGKHHFAVRRDNSFPGAAALDIFIDGQKQSTTTDANQGAGDITGNSGDGYIGYNTIRNTFYDGVVDDVRIYDKDLTDSQINQIYQNTKP